MLRVAGIAAIEVIRDIRGTQGGGRGGAHLFLVLAPVPQEPLLLAEVDAGQGLLHTPLPQLHVCVLWCVHCKARYAR